MLDQDETCGGTGQYGHCTGKSRSEELEVLGTGPGGVSSSPVSGKFEPLSDNSLKFLFIGIRKNPLELNEQFPKPTYSL